METSYNDYLKEYKIEYIGKQERWNDFPLDMYNDLVTGSTFIRRPEESILDMVARIRRQGRGKWAYRNY